MVKAELKQGVGKKSGKPYVCIVLTFPNGFQKYIFPQNDAEKFLYESLLNK